MKRMGNPLQTRTITYRYNWENLKYHIESLASVFKPIWHEMFCFGVSLFILFIGVLHVTLIHFIAGCFHLWVRMNVWFSFCSETKFIGLQPPRVCFNWIVENNSKKKVFFVCLKFHCIWCDHFVQNLIEMSLNKKNYCYELRVGRIFLSFFVDRMHSNVLYEWTKV